MFKFALIGMGVVFAMSAVKSAAAEKSRTVDSQKPFKGGKIELIVSIAHGGFEGNGVQSKGPYDVSCELRNKSSHDLPYDDTGYGSGFKLRLLDKKGAVVPPEKAWAQRMPNEDGIGKHATKLLPVGSSLVLFVNLKEAYGSRWENGSILKVSWEAGVIKMTGYDLFSETVAVETKISK
jgi:hypothetical protein